MYQIGCIEYPNTIIKFDEISRESMLYIASLIFEKRWKSQITLKHYKALAKEYRNFFSKYL